MVWPAGSVDEPFRRSGFLYRHVRFPADVDGDAGQNLFLGDPDRHFWSENRGAERKRRTGARGLDPVFDCDPTDDYPDHGLQYRAGADEHRHQYDRCGLHVTAAVYYAGLPQPAS